MSAGMMQSGAARSSASKMQGDAMQNSQGAMGGGH
jgi:hypothetical protein